MSDTGLSDTGLNFEERLKELEEQKTSLLYRKGVADRFSQTALARLNDIEEEINLINGFVGVAEVNAISPMSEVMEDLKISRLAMHPGRTDKVRRGAMSVKEKEKMAEERAEEEEKRKESNEQTKPNDKSTPQKPRRPGEKVEPEQPIKTPEERKEDIIEKLKQKDPRKQKEGLEELKKPENKDLGKDDPEFQKLVKDSGKRVEKFDKIRDSLRKNLRELMQSDSDVVKKNIAELRAGRIGSGMAGFKEIGQSTDTRFNSVAHAAKGLCDNVAALYKEFDIKPEEALSREAISEAKPIVTRQTGTKSKEDVAIDRNSRQNRYMGESNELSEEERFAYKKVKELYGVEADKLPPVDTETKRDMAIVRAIVHEDAQKPHGNIKPAMIIQAANDGR